MCRLKFAVPIVSDMSNLRYRRQHYATAYLSLSRLLISYQTLTSATLRNCVFITLITSQLPPPSYYHSPRTITTCLPSKKGRWIAGKAQTVALLRFACDTPAFFNLPNLSAVKTEGLHSVSTIILIGGT